MSRIQRISRSFISKEITMSDKINVEAILKRTLGKDLMREIHNTHLKEVLKTVTIKEIIEAVINKCAEKAPISFNDNSKQSILNIKKEIEYE